MSESHEALRARCERAEEARQHFQTCWQAEVGQKHQLFAERDAAIARCEQAEQIKEQLVNLLRFIALDSAAPIETGQDGCAHVKQLRERCEQAERERNALMEGNLNPAIVQLSTRRAVAVAEANDLRVQLADANAKLAALAEQAGHVVDRVLTVYRPGYVHKCVTEEPNSLLALVVGLQHTLSDLPAAAREMREKAEALDMLIDRRLMVIRCDGDLEQWAVLRTDVDGRPIEAIAHGQTPIAAIQAARKEEG